MNLIDLRASIDCVQEVYCSVIGWLQKYLRQPTPTAKPADAIASSRSHSRLVPIFPEASSPPLVKTYAYLERRSSNHDASWVVGGSW